jgi:iron complex transport system permease protein
LGFFIGVCLLLLVCLLSLALGSAEIAPRTVWDALFQFDPTSSEHLIIRTLRVPRTLNAVLVGAALAVAGGLMQGITRNPLADSGILGINAGAALAVVMAVFFLHINAASEYAWAAFIGATIAVFGVYALGSAGRGGPTPIKLTIAGAAITAMLGSATTAILLFNQRTAEEVRFWLVGSVAGRDLDMVISIGIYVVLGLVAALLVSRQVTTLSLGEDVARGLGVNVALVKGTVAAIVVVLAGASVALAGPIAFVGLVIPHAVRFFVGVDYRWISLYAVVFGAIFLLFSDILGRIIASPQELPVGVMTALIGGPVFVWLVRWKVRR